MIWCYVSKSNSTWQRFTHFPLVSHIYVSQSGQHWFRWCFFVFSAPSHYLSQWWVIVKWTPRNKPQWNFNQNTKSSIHENTSENIVCEMAAIWSRGRLVDWYLTSVCLQRYPAYHPPLPWPIAHVAISARSKVWHKYSQENHWESWVCG